MARQPRSTSQQRQAGLIAAAASLFPLAAAAWHLHARRGPQAPNCGATVAAGDWTAPRRLEARARACQGLCRTRVGLPGRLRRAREVVRPGRELRPWGTSALGPHLRPAQELHQGLSGRLCLSRRRLLCLSSFVLSRRRLLCLSSSSPLSYRTQSSVAA